jgi:menaquinone-dependent protoporphyrinogen IX oxidase
MLMFIIISIDMKILLIYSTWHGTVLTVAKDLIELLAVPIDLYDIENSEAPSPVGYDCVIFGCSVHDGHIQMSIIDYISGHCPVEKQIVAGLFCCSILGDEETQKVLERDIPAEVLNSFKVVELMGGIIYAKKLSFIERRVLQLISFDETKMKTLDTLKVRKFARHIEEENLLMEKERDYVRKHSGRIHYKAKKTET